MKFRYDKDDDALMIWFSQKPIDHAEQVKDVIVHFTKDDKPVLLEILDASQFLRKTSQVFPQNIRHQVFASSR